MKQESVVLLVVFAAFIGISAANNCGFFPPRIPVLVSKFANASDLVWVTDGSNYDDDEVIHQLLKSPAINLRAIVITNNAWSNIGAAIRHFRNVLAMYGREDIPVYGGSHFALQDELDAAASGLPPVQRYRSPIPPGSGAIYWADIMYGQGSYLPQSKVVQKLNDIVEDYQTIPAIVALINSLPGSRKMTILSTGTLTPLAKLFDASVSGLKNEGAVRSLMNRIEKLHIMGGAVYVGGNLYTMPNTNPNAEFNIFNDPLGAKYAIGNFSRYGVPVTLVPLDATAFAPITPAFLQQLAAYCITPECQLIANMSIDFQSNYYDPSAFYSEIFIWDATATQILINPQLITGQKQIKLKVVANQGFDGALQGATRECTPAEAAVAGECANVNVITSVDGAAVRNAFFALINSPINSAVRGLVCPF